MKLIYDTETDGLLDELTKMHCAVFKEYQEDNWFVFTEKALNDHFKARLSERASIKFFPLTKLTDLLESDKLKSLVCHNQLGFDLYAMKKLGFIDSFTCCPEDTINGRPVEIIDTLVMSRKLYPDRPLPSGCLEGVHNPVTNKTDKVSPHGLLGWGYRTRGNKPFIEDWRNLSTEEYVERCFEDVIINEATLEALEKEAADEAFGGEGWGDALATAKKDFHLFFEQELSGFPFDRELAKELLVELDEELDRLDFKCQKTMGLRPLPKNKQPTFPKKPFKKDGTLSSTAIKYGEKIGKTNRKTLEEYILRVVRGEEEPVLLEEQTQLSHQDDVKLHLFKNGWVPTLFRTKDITRDQFKKERTEKEQYLLLKKYIAEVKESPYKKLIYKELGVNFEAYSFDQLLKQLERHKRFLPSSPQLKDQRGDLCPNLERLDSEFGKDVARWLSLRNRRTVIASFDDPDKGWINNPRLDIDGRLGQGNAGYSNTNRYKHRTIVNVPSCGALYGREMRSLFTGTEDKFVLGYDAAALENRVAAHYSTPYDGGAYADIILDGDSHTANAQAYSEAAGFTVSRGAGKGITYACLQEDITEVNLGEDEYKPIEDIEVGDKVLGFNVKRNRRELTEVTKAPESRFAKVYRVAGQVAGETTQKAALAHVFNVYCTADHRWYGILPSGKKGWFKTGEITNKHQILTKKGIVVSNMVVEYFGRNRVRCIKTKLGNFYMRQFDTETLTGNCLYGAQPPKLGAMLGGDKTLGKAIQDAFWDTNVGLKLLKEKLEIYWVKTGKKYILGLDGGKIYTRSKHSLLNCLFQSAGAIIMSKAMTLIKEYCVSEGVPYERAAFVHDEGQFLVAKKDVEFWRFKTEDEAEDFKQHTDATGKLTSAIKKVADDEFVVCYSKLGEICLRALQDSGNYYKMRVPIEGEYMVGNNWAETH